MSILDEYIIVILTQLVTKRKLLKFLSALEELIELSYMAKDISYFAKFDEVDKNFFNLLTKGLAIHELERDREIATALVEALRTALIKVEEINVTFAVIPTEEFLQTVYKQFYQHLKRKFCLTVSVDSTIVSGIQVSYGGNYIDLSLKKKIDDYFMTNRDYVLSRL